MQKTKFKTIVSDIHSVDNLLASKINPIVLSIVSAAGFELPKETYFSTFSLNETVIENGSLDTITESIIAKKIALGSTHIVIDLAYGENIKIHSLSEAKILSEKLEKLAKKFKIKIRVLIYKTTEPAGRGIGPNLEIRDSIKVLEQMEDRSLDLEIRSLNLACNLLEICLEDSDKKTKDFVKKHYFNIYNWALTLLQRGIALEKFKELIKTEIGSSNIKFSDLKPAKESLEIKADKEGKVNSINIKNVLSITKILGVPFSKASGIYLNKKIGETFHHGEVLYTLFSENVYNLREGKLSLKNFPLLTYE